MTFLELAKSRYSVRKFTDQKVEKEKLDKILEAGNIAPTAKNIQPQRVYVIQSEEALKKLSELTPCVFGASTVILLAYDKQTEWTNPFESEKGIHSGVEDVSIVATHMMLEAIEQGLGTCWVNYFPNSKVEELFDLPDNEKSVLLLLVGYIAEDSKPTANHESCKSLNEYVKYL